MKRVVYCIHEYDGTEETASTYRAKLAMLSDMAVDGEVYVSCLAIDYIGYFYPEDFEREAENLMLSLDCDYLVVGRPTRDVRHAIRTLEAHGMEYDFCVEEDVKCYRTN